MSRPPHLRLVAGEAAPPRPALETPSGATLEDPALRAELAAVEDAIEGLSARAETCAKLARLALGLIVGGAVLLVLLVLGLLGQAPVALIFGLSGLLGGLALAGTNASTRAEIAAALAEREAERDDLRGFLALGLKRSYREE